MIFVISQAESFALKLDKTVCPEITKTVMGQTSLFSQGANPTAFQTEKAPTLFGSFS